MRVFLWLFVGLGPIACSGQVLGSWDGHLPYRSTISVALTPDWAYASSGLAYFGYHRTDLWVARHHKANGLSDIGTQLLNYYPERDLLLVTYSNANIDLVTNAGVTNLPDIKNASIVGKKDINHVYFDDNLAYLSTSFGIIVVDLDRQEIKDTYKPDSIDAEIWGTATTSSRIITSTSNGIFVADLVGSNLLDFGSWTKQQSAVGIHDLDIENGLVAFLDGTVFVTSNDSVFKFNGSNWDFFYSNAGWKPVHLSSGQGDLVVTEHAGAPDSTQITIVQSNGAFTSYKNISPYPKQVELSDDGVLWIADLFNGLLTYKLSDGSSQSIVPNGPRTNSVFELDAAEGNLWVAPGGISSTWGLNYKQDGFFHYENGWWTNYSNIIGDDTTFDWITVMIDPNNSDRVFLGSHWAGVAVVENGEVTIYDKDNSILQPPSSGADNVTHVGGFAMDEAGNLWITNNQTDQSIVIWKADGTWVDFTALNSTLSQIVIDEFNQKWFLVGRSLTEGFVVYDHGNDLDNAGDDKSTILNTSFGTGGLHNGQLFCVARDHDGEIWAGTGEGIAIFYCPSEVFNDGCDADRVVVEKDGFLAYLLEAEEVRDIEVDGANRKWAATNNGVFLLSEDGTQELLHFTESNSPLFSNNVLDIAIDHSSGLVWFGTGLGINSYQGDATLGGSTHEECLIYPNPVREGYTGPIVIKGLVQGAHVKITDAVGNLVFEDNANGGLATWNGRLLDGSRAQTGVYYVFSTNADGSEKHVCKLLMVN